MLEQRTYDDRDGWIWFDGKLVPWREASVHVLTHGLHYASSVFEGQRAYNGAIFKLTEHSERLGRSAACLSTSRVSASRRRLAREFEGSAMPRSVPGPLSCAGTTPLVGKLSRRARPRAVTRPDRTERV